MQRGLFCAFVFILLGGCSGLGLVRAPDVSLVDIHFTDLTVFETSGEMTLRLTNENADNLALTGGVFSLFLNGVRVGKGLTSERMEVPSFGSTTHRVPIYINNLALATRIAGLLEQPELDYLIKARLRLETSYGARRLRSSYRGRFSASGDARERLAPAEDPIGAAREAL